MRNTEPIIWLTRLCLVALLAVCAAEAPAGSQGHTADAVSATVLENTPDRVLIRYSFNPPTMETVQIDGRKYVELALGKESLMKVAGAPEVPNVCESVIVGDLGKVKVNVLGATYTDFEGLVPVPSKGFILRRVNPDDVPYTFGPEYAEDAFFPAEVAQVRTPYIQRDFRAVVLETHPVQSNPSTGTLRVYRDLLVEVITEGGGGINEFDRRSWNGKIDPSFGAIYRNHFLNYAEALQRYAPLDEVGDLLVICHDAWLPNIAPLVTHKNNRGIPTTAVGVSTIPGGNDATAIKNYIQNLYNTTDLAFVLLVGDIAQVASPTASGGASDPSYAKLAGGDDYPEIMVGRYSAENTAQVDTQVTRTITYETTPAPTQDWFWRGTGIASAQGAGQGDEGQADWVHMDEIRDWLMAFGYTEVDQFNDSNPTPPTAADVTVAVNAGRGIINYCGHGSMTSWATSGFDINDIDALVNDDMLPFIVTVACNNGEFDSGTCFAEAWLRATNGAAPTGAIGCYASSIGQSWAPPMEAQDEFNLLLCAESYISYGALCFAGSCSMMDDYDAGGIDMFNTWILFGDPSLLIAVTCTSTGTIALDSPKYACSDTATITVIDCDLNLDDLVEDTVLVDIESTSEPTPESVLLTEIGPASGQFAGSIPLDTTNSPGVLWVAPGDTVTATYIDADDGQGNYNVVLTATAVVDCTPPTISNVQTINIDPRDADVTFDCDEPALGTVHYGLSCGSLTETALGVGYAMSPTVHLANLQINTPYFYIVEAADEAGNVTIDDNGGACYTFSTPDVPDYFTELFASGNDLEGLSLIFTPDGSNNYYSGCVEPIIALPTDPTGGATLTLSDDDNEMISFSGGVQVLLYGSAYSSCYVGSNGYVTFGGGDTDYSETLEEHFNLPRISGLYDDLNPSSGGTVSWKETVDRVAVTWEDVPQYSGTDANTFQIEMFFDGMITITCLSLDAADGLCGLSEGNGLDPSFYMSDLSAMGSCGPRPPTASSASVQTAIGTPVTIDLMAGDDGLPDPPAALTYIVTSLPAHGTLTDLMAGVITSVPYTLASGGNRVVYTPSAWYAGPDGFHFKANDGGIPPEGGDSNIAAISITVGGPAMIYSFPLDTDPGWPTSGEWAFGAPTGQGASQYGNPDPTSGATGNYVYGVNLYGDYSITPGGPYYVTLGPLDLSTATGVELKFQRWLNTDYQNYAYATIDVSNNGSTWVNTWDNGHSPITDSAWALYQYDISAVADNQAKVYVRWGYEIGTGAFAYSGWNIDDIEIWGVVPIVPPICPGDSNCDGEVSWRDVDYFVAGINDNLAGWVAMFAPGQPTCPYENNDVNDDGSVNWRDIDPLVDLMNTTCP
ncbi:MAG: hypothetical protein KAY37_05715 [Phycisphaerae bacterium]|nr:hypothetical protein [Phycisphaerae bacterium]